MYILGLALAGAVLGAPKRVLYVTHSAGFRHSSIELSQQVLAGLSPDLDVTSTEDLSYISAGRLRDFDAIFFFTSGDLALSPQQKDDLLAFVRAGKGFGGVHSATDTFYFWPEYGDLIGAYFDGHPWVQEVTIDIEDPDHPAMKHLAPAFKIFEEIYQFLNFSRDRVRVLMTLDVRSVDLSAQGVNRTDEDFALAWCRPYGAGRVFYTALGHFEQTWQDARFQQMLRGALLWLTGQASGEAAPRVLSDTRFNAPAAVSPGDVFVLYGENLTTGSTMTANYSNWPIRLAGTSVLAGGVPIPLVYASPAQINAQLPYEIVSDIAAGREVTLTVGSAVARVKLAAATPRILAVVRAGAAISIYATGLGVVRPAVGAGTLAPFSPLAETVARPDVTIAGQTAGVLFSGLAPGWVGLYQVNAEIPAGVAGSVEVVITMAAASAQFSATL